VEEEVEEEEVEVCVVVVVVVVVLLLLSVKDLLLSRVFDPRTGRESGLTILRPNPEFGSRA
jgi:hypothetical protein